MFSSFVRNLAKNTKSRIVLLTCLQIIKKNGMEHGSSVTIWDMEIFDEKIGANLNAGDVFFLSCYDKHLQITLYKEAQGIKHKLKKLD